jgi:hypothetical protein
MPQPFFSTAGTVDTGQRIGGRGPTPLAKTVDDIQRQQMGLPPAPGVGINSHDLQKAVMPWERLQNKAQSDFAGAAAAQASREARAKDAAAGFNPMNPKASFGAPVHSWDMVNARPKPQNLLPNRPIPGGVPMTGAGENPMMPPAPQDDFMQREWDMQAPSTIDEPTYNPMEWGEPPELGHGGPTHAPMFITGDDPDKSGSENKEIILNPTGAPIHVVPMDRMMTEGMPKFGMGTIPTMINDPLIKPATPIANLTTPIVNLSGLRKSGQAGTVDIPWFGNGTVPWAGAEVPSFHGDGTQYLPQFGDGTDYIDPQSGISIPEGTVAPVPNPNTGLMTSRVMAPNQYSEGPGFGWGAPPATPNLEVPDWNRLNQVIAQNRQADPNAWQNAAPPAPAEQLPPDTSLAPPAPTADQAVWNRIARSSPEGALQKLLHEEKRADTAAEQAAREQAGQARGQWEQQKFQAQQQLAKDKMAQAQAQAQQKLEWQKEHAQRQEKFKEDTSTIKQQAALHGVKGEAEAMLQLGHITPDVHSFISQQPPEMQKEFLKVYADKAKKEVAERTLTPPEVIEVAPGISGVWNKSTGKFDLLKEQSPQSGLTTSQIQSGLQHAEKMLHQALPADKPRYQKQIMEYDALLKERMAPAAARPAPAGPTGAQGAPAAAPAPATPAAAPKVGRWKNLLRST